MPSITSALIESTTLRIASEVRIVKVSKLFKRISALGPVRLAQRPSHEGEKSGEDRNLEGGCDGYYSGRPIHVYGQANYSSLPGSELLLMV